MYMDLVALDMALRKHNAWLSQESSGPEVMSCMPTLLRMVTGSTLGYSIDSGLFLKFQSTMNE